MSSRIFLAIVGAIYVLLAGWCAISPKSTAAAVGFELRPGSGDSEYLTVYGGMQLGLGLFFLWPLIRPESAATVLAGCLFIHAAIVVFRSISLLRYSGLGGTTFVLIGTEWVILLATLWITFGQAGPSTAS